MIRVHFDPSTLKGADRVWWDTWQKRAEKARDKVLTDVAAGKDPEFNDAVWGDLKRWLLKNAFHGKCAYCESLVEDATDNPAAEHYRPKRAPTVRDAAGAVAVVQVQGKDHPGYYWLAYEWRNLVPACSRCNSNGKGNSFPVRKAHVAAHDAKRNDPADLDALEEPLLLHPYFDDLTKHLSFGEKGVVAALNGDDRGAASIRDYRLEREGLRKLREDAQELAWLRLNKLIGDDDLSKVDLAPWRSGASIYSAAVLDYVRPRLRELVAERLRRAAEEQARAARLQSILDG